MTPERWRQVEELFHSALVRPAEERAVFLNEACGSDQLLRAEIDSLFAAHENTGSFLNPPTYIQTAKPLKDDLAILW